jgi:hypothetical protein
VDYLVPSYQGCHQYLQSEGLEGFKEEIQIIIDIHHLLYTYKGPYEKLAEVFRRADLIDFSLGLVKNKVEKVFIKEVRNTILNAGFH